MKILQSINVILLQFCVIRSCIVLIITGLFCFIIRIVYQKTAPRFNKRPQFLSATLLKALYRPLLIFVAVIGITYALEWLCLAGQLGNSKLFHFLRNLFFIGLCAWFLWDFVSLSSQAFLKQDTKSKVIDSTFVYAINHIAKLAIIIITVLSLFQLLGLSIAGVLAFGGMGGIIIGFASKDMLANIFGSLMLFLDRPFVIGDQIALPALKVQGQVEAIGWRVCRVLSPNGCPVYIPNALFSNLLIENQSRIQYRRFSCSISLRYQDLSKLPAILQEIKSLLNKNSAIDKTRTISVNLNELANSSLNISINAYTNTINSTDFSAAQQALYLELLGCIHRHGAKWAFPSSNIFLNTEELKFPSQK
ncbi:MAG: mechanosensitive ion channel domain-containing protein [Pseudomonadota bacterium]